MSNDVAVENKRGLSPAALLVAGAFYGVYRWHGHRHRPTRYGKSFGVEAVDLNIGISAYLITTAVLILPAAGLPIASARVRYLVWR